MKHKVLVILGFGGHARSVADLALACGYQKLMFVDANATPGEHFLGYGVIQNFDKLDSQGVDAFAASGDAQQRKCQCDLIEKKGFNLVSLVSPSATIGAGSIIGPGCFVGHHAHIGPMAKIGLACIINTGAVVEHEASIGAYSHVSVNSVIAGRSKLGAFSMLGAGAIIIDGLSVADDVTIGAGTVVITPIKIAGTYVGIPARKVG